MRETPGCSDCPTVIVLMLNERRRSSETTRFRTPGWSSTSTTSVWARFMVCLLAVVETAEQHVAIARARRHDRPDIGLRLDHEFDQHRTLDAPCLFDCRHDLFIAQDSKAGHTECLSELYEIRSEDFDFGVVLVVEEVLPLADHPQVPVVDDRDVDVQILLDRGRQLAKGHLETTVADD